MKKFAILSALFCLIASAAQATAWSNAELTAIETGGGTDDGFQVFGNAAPVANDQLYFVKAYFNGASGCREYRVNIDSIFPGPDSISTSQINLTNLVPACPGFALDTTILSPNDNSLCFATSLANGSNARQSLVLSTKQVENKNNLFKIYPNPSSSKVFVTYRALSNQQVVFSIRNILGQRICEDYYSIAAESGKHQFYFDFKSVNANSGIYFIYLSVGESSQKSKIIYSSDQ